MHQYEGHFRAESIRYLEAGLHEARHFKLSVAPALFFITRSRPHLLPPDLRRLLLDLAISRIHSAI